MQSKYTIYKKRVQKTEFHKMLLVADSSSLILLAKCHLLTIVGNLYDVRIPKAVHQEVASRGLVERYPDAALISRHISSGMIKIQESVGEHPLSPLSLHKGEAEALRLARMLNGSILATDDGKAIKAARFLNIPFIITPKIVVGLFGLQKISLKTARLSLEKLSMIGRYSPEIIAQALISLMEIKNDETNYRQDT